MLKFMSSFRSCCVEASSFGSPALLCTNKIWGLRVAVLRLHAVKVPLSCVCLFVKPRSVYCRRFVLIGSIYVACVMVSIAFPFVSCYSRCYM